MGMREDLEKAIDVSRRLIVKEDVPLSEIVETARNLSIVSMMMQNVAVQRLNTKTVEIPA